MKRLMLAGGFSVALSAALLSGRYDRSGYSALPTSTLSNPQSSHLSKRSQPLKHGPEVFAARGRVQRIGALASSEKRPRLPRRRSWNARVLSDLVQRKKGDEIRLELPGGNFASASISYLHATNGLMLYASASVQKPEPGSLFFQTQTRKGKAGDFVGIIEFPASRTAYRIEASGPDGALELVERTLADVKCVDLPLPIGSNDHPLATV